MKEVAVKLLTRRLDDDGGSEVANKGAG